MPALFNFSSPTLYDKDSPVLTTPSPRRPPLAPLSFPNDLGLTFRSPFQSPAQAQPLSSSYAISKPQPINADDEEGRVFASSASTSFAQLFSAASSQPLLTPAKSNTTRTALSIKNMNYLPEGDHNPLSTRAGMKRKSNVHCTPLKVNEGVEFQRLAPLPPPKTPAGKVVKPDHDLGHHTTTFRRLEIRDRMNDLEDSGYEGYAEWHLMQKNASKRATVPCTQKGLEATDSAVSPGGHVSKRRAQSRSIPENDTRHGPTPRSPGSPLQSQRGRSRNSGIATVPSATSYRGRASPGSSSSESGSPLPRRGRNFGVGRPQVKQPPLFSRPPLNRQDNLSAATLFFGPTIPQPDLTYSRPRTNSSVLSKSAGEAHPATKHTRVPSNRHSYAGSTDSFWSRIQRMSPSTPHRQKNGMDTDDEDMSFDGPASSSFSNISDIPSPVSKRPLPSKYQESRRASTGNYGDFPTVPGLESPGSDFSLATPALEPHGSSGWPQLNIKIEDESDLFSSSSDGADVDEFIVRTLAAASKGPGPGTKRVPGTPVKKVRTAFLGPDRPWQSAATSKIGLKEECDFRKVPRKSLPAAFPQMDGKRGKSLLEQCSDSEGEEDSPSGRKNGKYAAASLGLGYPPTLPPPGPGYTESATGKNGPFFLTRNRWLTRRSSSGAFSSGSESTAQGENTPTRSKGMDWQLPKLRITTSSERSASGSSTSSGIANSPTDRKKSLGRHVVSPELPRRRSLVERASYETLAVQETSRFERDFETVDELGSGEFGNVIKVRSKAGNDAQVYAIKKSKRFEGVKHRLRLREEVDVLKHLSDSASREGLYGGHPNVLAYIDSWEEDEALYIQTELCESGSLSRFLWEYGKVFPRLDESRVWKIIVDLSNGLRFIHGAGVIHLDLKPSNVFITGEGRLKIGDFGMASTWPRPKPTVDELCEEGNGGFEREGDKLYLAPEILQGRYSQAADIFSFGMTILETASNILVPDQGESWHRLRREDFTQVDWHSSEELLQLIRQMMRTEPSHRLTVHQVYTHAVVSRARRNMEEAYRTAKKQGESVFAASPLASVPEGFLEEILGGGGECAMDLSP